MVESVDWGARRRVAVVPVDGFDVTFKKRGLGNLNDKVWTIPGLGEVIAALVDTALAEGDESSRKSAMEQALKSALKAAAAGGGGETAGKVGANLARKALPALLDLIAEDTVLASDDERPAYRDWLDTLGPRGLLDAVSGWIKLNMPEVHGPFVLAAATVLSKGKGLLDGAAETLARKPESTPAPSETPTSPETETQDVAA